MAINFQYPIGATPIDPDEALGLIPGHITTQAELNAWEELNIEEGAAWIKRQNVLLKFNEGLVRDLHHRMFNKTWRWSGKFRQSAKSIGIDWTQISVTLKDLLENTLYQINHQSMSNDEIVIRFHHRLVWIHAFPNGNGRHARLLADGLMMSLGGKRFSWGGSQSLVKPGVTRQHYLAALRAADQGSYESLMEFARK